MADSPRKWRARPDGSFIDALTRQALDAGKPEREDTIVSSRVRDIAAMDLRLHAKLIGWLGAFAAAFAALDWLTGATGPLREFLECWAGFTSAWLAVAGSVQLAARRGLRKGEGREGGYVVAGGLLGFFVVMPLAVLLAEKLVDLLLAALP